ncbi:DEKNAAC100060 [Brettanomyces naardenensis]|uniref:DEKNAAC100060 n=1 Tax=Brettanomyces naardenensis TaxID=13370 RepID=A0A448YEG4_BRENA|nr:DEKNAAC100060 [Brettanomyces naardenensis]
MTSSKQKLRRKKMAEQLERETPEQRKKRFFLQADVKKERLRDTADVAKRFMYLLGLTDLFRQFIDVNAAKDKNVSRMVHRIDLKNAARKNASGSSRTRKSEREEDEELLEDEQTDESTMVLTDSPSYVHGTLRDYQVQGLNWLISLYENRLSGILADEMGLGKTLQTISFLGWLRYYRGIDGPFLVVVPKSTLDNWRREFLRWTPEVNVLVLQGNKEEREKLIKERLLTADFDVCITSYEMVIREKSKLGKLRWEEIIIDEAHRIKNEQSSLSQIIRLFYSRNRLLITGTPLQNNLHELWALLNFLLPDVFGDDHVFDAWFESQGDDQDELVKKLHKVLFPFLLRRVKADVETSLLPKKEVNVYVGMTAMQIKWYRKLLEKDIDAVNGVLGKREGKTRLLNIVMQLRKCCNHPYLFEGAEPGPPYTTDEHLVYNSGKMIVLDKLLKKMKEEGSRVLIFSQMSRLLDIMEDYCFFRKFEYCRIDGSTAHEDRISAIDDFNKPDSEKFVFLLTTRAGGLGINLTSADVVILYDSDWNPQADLQAMDRAHRIGQKKQVKVYRFVTENAIEEKVLERAAQKLRLDQLVIQQGRTSMSQNSSKIGNSKEQLLEMIQHGAQKVFDETGKDSPDLDDGIDEILNRGEERTKTLKAKYANLGLDDLQNFTSDQSAYEWNGENFAKKEHQQLNVWIHPAKRQRKEHQYSVDGYYRDVMSQLRGSPSPRSSTPRAPKQYVLHDFQFFPSELRGLLRREQLAFRKKIGYKVPLPDGSSSEEPMDIDEESEERRNKLLRDKQKADQDKIDSAVELTEEDQKQKQELLESGFGDWNKRDFMSFIHGSARYGMRDYDQIAKDLKHKNAEDVKKYADVFWQRYKEIDGYERYINQIEQGEKKLRKTRLQQEILKEKIETLQIPLEQLTIQYPPNNSKRMYTLAEDRFLLFKVYEHGLTNPNLYTLIKRDISLEKTMRFSFYFKSRTTGELSRRVSTLLLAITREVEGPEAFKRKLSRRDRSQSSAVSSRQSSLEPHDKHKLDGEILAVKRVKLEAN